MNIILNDLSIAEQFQDADDFVDSLYDHTLSALECVSQHNGAIILKSSEIYNKNIYPQMPFGIFINNNSHGYAELSKFKRLLVQLIDEPYWDNEPQSECEGEYSSRWTGSFKGYNPNFISEALERNCDVFSLKHNDFNDFKLEIVKNSKSYLLNNFYDKKTVSEVLFLKKHIGFCEYLLSKSYPLDIVFLKNHNKYFADEFYDNGDLSVEDIQGISDTFSRHIDEIKNGIHSKLTKSITHKNITYFEFRDKLSNSREFRIFYYRKDNKIFYLNSLIKKTQTTPDSVKEHSISLIKAHLM